MKIDKDKLKRLKLLHLSYLTDADREAAEVTKDGFTLNGILIEGVSDLESKLSPDAEDYPSKDIGDGATKTELPDGSVVVEVPLKSTKKKSSRKKKA